MLYVELKLRRVLNGCSSCSKAFEGLPECKPANTKPMGLGGGYVYSEGPRELLGLVPARSTTDPGPMCPFPGTPVLMAAVLSIASCLGCWGLVRKCVRFTLPRDIRAVWRAEMIPLQ